MNPDELSTKSQSTEELLSSFLMPEEEDAMQQSGNQGCSQHLPHYSLVCQIDRVEAEARQAKYNHLMLKINTIQEDAKRFRGIYPAHEEIGFHLKFLVSNSEVLIFILNDPEEDSLALPPNQHGHVLLLMQRFQSLLLQNLGWKNKLESNEWSTLHVILKKVAEVYEEIARDVDHRLQEYESLHWGAGKILEKLSELSLK